MTSFSDSYLGQIRSLVGSQMLLVPGARIIIENIDHQILLQKRSDFEIWGLPGGNAEIGEDMQSSVIREVFEETGLSVMDCEPFGFGSNPDLETIEFPNGDKCQFFVLNFFTRNYAGDLKTSEESLALEWFHPNSLPQMLPNMEASVNAYRRFQDTRLFQFI